MISNKSTLILAWVHFSGFNLGFLLDAAHWLIRQMSLARLAQSAERKALALVVVVSSLTVGVLCVIDVKA